MHFVRLYTVISCHVFLGSGSALNTNALKAYEVVSFQTFCDRQSLRTGASRWVHSGYHSPGVRGSSARVEVRQSTLFGLYLLTLAKRTPYFHHLETSCVNAIISLAPLWICVLCTLPICVFVRVHACYHSLILSSTVVGGWTQMSCKVLCQEAISRASPL